MKDCIKWNNELILNYFFKNHSDKKITSWETKKKEYFCWKNEYT